MKRKFNQIDSSSQLTEQNEKCPICMDDLKTKNLTITKCGHKFCHTCLDAHSCNDFKCPICRSDMDTKIKNNKLCNCDCDIRYSVSKAINVAKPHLHNLSLRIARKFLDSFANHDLNLNENESESESESESENKDINELRQKICLKLNDNENFKIDILKFVYEEILHFSFTNSTESCYNLKTIIESL